MYTRRTTRRVCLLVSVCLFEVGFFPMCSISFTILLSVFSGFCCWQWDNRQRLQDPSQAQIGIYIGMVDGWWRRWWWWFNGTSMSARTIVHLTDPKNLMSSFEDIDDDVQLGNINYWASCTQVDSWKFCYSRLRCIHALWLKKINSKNSTVSSVSLQLQSKLLRSNKWKEVSFEWW